MTERRWSHDSCLTVLASITANVNTPVSYGDLNHSWSEGETITTGEQQEDEPLDTCSSNGPFLNLHTNIMKAHLECFSLCFLAGWIIWGGNVHTTSTVIYESIYHIET